MKAFLSFFFFSSLFLPSLLLIFCKASVLRGVALREDRLFTDGGESSGSTRRRRRPAVAARGRPRPSAEVLQAHPRLQIPGTAGHPLLPVSHSRLPCAEPLLHISLIPFVGMETSELLGLYGCCTELSRNCAQGCIPGAAQRPHLQAEG